MNRDETIKVLAVLQANYPDSFKGMSDEALKGRIKLWQTVFEEDLYLEVTAVVMAHVASDTNRFMPPVGVIKSKLAEIKGGQEELSDMEAWALVSKATRNGFYGAEKEFEKLPPQVQTAIGDPAMLKAWSQLPANEVETVIQSNFMRSYRAVGKREKDRLSLPASTKKFFQQLEGGENPLKALCEGMGEKTTF